MKNIIRVIPVRNGVFARLGGGGPKGILPGKCGVLGYNKTEVIKELKERYPADDYEIIDVNLDDNHKPFKPVNTTKSQVETTKTASLVLEKQEKINPEPELGTTQQIEQYIQGMTKKSDS